MRKIISMALSIFILLSLCSVSVFAAAIQDLNTSVNPTTNEVVVSGQIDSGAGQEVTIKVLDTQDHNKLEYLNQTTSEANGKFKFFFTPTKMENGIYLAKVGGMAVSVPAEKTFNYVAGDTTGQTPSINITDKTIDTNKQITIKGTISSGPGKQITVKVYAPNNRLDYIGQTTSGTNGGFTFTYTSTSNASGSYNVKVGGEDVEPVNTTFSSSENSTDHCFIATACFGSKYAPSVALLRQFRDRYLLTNSPGQAFVKYYYRNSPPIAGFIAQNEGLKLIVRGILTPIVGVVYLIFHPLLFYLLAGLLVLFAVVWCTRKRKNNFIFKS